MTPTNVKEKTNSKRQVTLADALKKKRPDLYKIHQNPTPKMRLAMNLFDLRSKKGKTQKDLADQAGIGIATYQRIEEAQPTANPSMDVMEKIAVVLKVDVSDLLKSVKI